MKEQRPASGLRQKPRCETLCGPTTWPTLCACTPCELTRSPALCQVLPRDCQMAWAQKRESLPIPYRHRPISSLIPDPTCMDATQNASMSFERFWVRGQMQAYVRPIVCGVSLFPRARLEMRGPGPNRLREPESSRIRPGFPDLDSLTIFPYPSSDLLTFLPAIFARLALRRPAPGRFPAPPAVPPLLNARPLLSGRSGAHFPTFAVLGFSPGCARIRRGESVLMDSSRAVTGRRERGCRNDGASQVQDENTPAGISENFDKIR